jgi:probable rRNA maturation factor
MTIEVANESGVTVDETAIASAAQYTLDSLGVSPQAELSVLLVVPEVMAELHERWMDESGPTDVMAFPMDGPTDAEDLEVLDGTRRPDATEPPPGLLGDVVLCPTVAREGARKAGHKLSDELHLLTVHGVLHLLGYDHGEPDDEREMFALQNQLLDRWQRSRTEAAERLRQRSADEQVLGTVGLDDG